MLQLCPQLPPWDPLPFWPLINLHLFPIGAKDSLQGALLSQGLTQMQVS